MALAIYGERSRFDGESAHPRIYPGIEIHFFEGLRQIGEYSIRLSITALSDLDMCILRRFLLRSTGATAPSAMAQSCRRCRLFKNGGQDMSASFRRWLGKTILIKSM